MSFTPAIPTGGLTGWALLSRTKERQTAAMASTTEYKRDEDYFRAKIGKINTAEELVSDRRLLKVVLGAFGLESDINNKFFVRKVLEDGTFENGSLANRLANKQYLKMSEAFGFGDFPTPSSKQSDFPDTILQAYKGRQFELAVGEQNGDLRLALNAQRELGAIAGKTGSSEDSRWFAVMGNGPLRKVFEKALGLPSSLGTLDLDRQLAVFKARAASQLGNASVTQFTDPAKVETLVRKFLIKSEAEAATSSSASGGSAAQLLQQAASRSRRF